MKNQLKFAGYSAAAILATTTALWAEEYSDALRSAPAPVQSAVVQLTGGAEIHEFGMETENGKSIYELEYKIKGIKYGADIDPTSGQVLTREVEVDASNISPAAIAAATKAHADGKLHEATIVNAGDKLYYEIEIKTAKEEHELQIDAAGNILADTVEAPEADENDSKDAEKGEAKGHEKSEKHEDKEDKD
jgi:uncharacterized membrane protein YkoI